MLDCKYMSHRTLPWHTSQQYCQEIQKTARSTIMDTIGRAQGHEQKEDEYWMDGGWACLSVRLVAHT